MSKLVEISRRERILRLMDEIRPVNKYTAAEKVEQFILEELNKDTAEHAIKLQDLMLIHSIASKTMIDTNFRSSDDNKDVRAWCYVDAIICWLRSKELISFTVKYTKKK